MHGGLRYLEHFEFDLVFEASQERRTLLRIATHLVWPLEFHFPIFRDGRIGRRKLDAGMWLYDALSLFRNIERHQTTPRPCSPANRGCVPRGFWAARATSTPKSTMDRLQAFLAPAGVKALRKVDADKVPLPGERVVAERPHLLAEAVYAVRSEMALHVEDILFRRMRVGLETRSGTPEAARRVAEVVAPELDWTGERKAEEVKRALTFRAVDDGAIRELAARAQGVR